MIKMLYLLLHLLLRSVLQWSRSALELLSLCCTYAACAAAEDGTPLQGVTLQEHRSMMPDLKLAPSGLAAQQSAKRDYDHGAHKNCSDSCDDDLLRGQRGARADQAPHLSWHRECWTPLAGALGGDSCRHGCVWQTQLSGTIGRYNWQWPMQAMLTLASPRNAAAAWLLCYSSTQAFTCRDADAARIHGLAGAVWQRFAHLRPWH